MDLEYLLTDRSGFGLESATFLQRAHCRILSGAPLGDLLDRASDFDRRCLETSTGCSPADLPTVQPQEAVDIDPVRTGKTLRDVAQMVRLSQTVDVSLVRAGEEPPRISVLSTSIDTARAFRGHMGIIRERPALRALVVGEDADSMTLRHPSGCAIQIRVIAAQRGGYSLASRWSAGVSFQEAPGWYSTDKIVSLEDSRDTVLGRLLPGAQALYSGSPWQAAGWCYQAFSESYGKPSADLVVLKAGMVDGVSPAEQLNPYYWTPERVERVRRTSPRTFRMHVLNEFGAGVSCFDFDAVERAFRPFKQQYRGLGRPFMVLDPSSGKKDAFTYAVVRRVIPQVPLDAFAHQVLLSSDGSPGWVEHDERGRETFHAGLPPLKEGAEQTVESRPFYWFQFVRGWEGSFWDQKPADELIAEIASVAHVAGARVGYCDQREFYALSAIARHHKLRLEERPFTSGSKEKAVAIFRRWLAAGEVRFPQHARMKSELHNFVEKPTPGGGFTFGARGSGHDDYATLPLIAALATTDPDQQARQWPRDY